MKLSHYCLLGVAALVALSAMTAPAQAQNAGREVHITGVQGDDLYLAGGRVSVDSEVTGDVNASGGRIRIGGQVSGDVGALGGQVSVVGAVGDDVRVGGGQVDIDAKIGGDLVAGAFSVAVQPGTAIGGKAILSGAEVSVAGRIAGDLSIASGSATISGTIGGDVEIASAEIKILPGARIGGNLRYTSGNEAEIAKDAVIAGEITRRVRDHDEETSTSVVALVGGGFSLAWLIGLVAMGTLIMVAFPESLATATRNIREAAWQSFGYGLLVIFAVPAAILFCFIIIIGIPVAVALAAAFAAALFVAYLTTAVLVGDYGLRFIGRADTAHRGWRILALLVSLLVLGVVGWIPIIGWLITFVTLTLGLGAWALQVFQVRAPGSGAVA